MLIERRKCPRTREQRVKYWAELVGRVSKRIGRMALVTFTCLVVIIGTQILRARSSELAQAAEAVPHIVYKTVGLVK